MKHRSIRPAAIFGVAAGTAGIGFYLWSRSSLLAAIPDPVWVLFVNSALLMFSAIFISVRVSKVWRRLKERRQQP